MTFKLLLGMVLAGLGVNLLLDALGMPGPWWRYLVVDIIVMFTIAFWLDRRPVLRYLHFRWRYWRDFHKPLVLDEDGGVHVPILAPGEAVEMIIDADTGKPIGAQVRGRNGKVRVRSDWSGR